MADIKEEQLNECSGEKHNGGNVQVSKDNAHDRSGEFIVNCVFHPDPRTQDDNYYPDFTDKVLPDKF